MSNSYSAVSALIFAIVAFVHLGRLVKSWPVHVGHFAEPAWPGLPLVLRAVVTGGREVLSPDTYRGEDGAGAGT